MAIALHLSAFDQSGHGRGWDRDGYCCEAKNFGLTSAASAGGHRPTAFRQRGGPNE